MEGGPETKSTSAEIGERKVWRFGLVQAYVLMRLETSRQETSIGRDSLGLERTVQTVASLMLILANHKVDHNQ